MPDNKDGLGKVVTGCGIGCLGIVIIITIAILGGGWLLVDKVRSIENEFVEMGMVKQDLDDFLGAIEVEDPVDEPTYYVAQLVSVSNGSTKPIGFLSQYVVLEGEFKEKVYFRGQIIKILPGTKLHQGLDVLCQVIIQQGEVAGEIDGYYQMLTEESNEEFDGLWDRLLETSP
ncbi:MAG: hypothetical protein AAGA18_10695 [Verrucomicrobiota bacterium]